MTAKPCLKQLPRETKRTQCADYDDNCYGIEDKVHCYLYDPTRGMCPFLSSHSKDVKDTP